MKREDDQELWDLLGEAGKPTVSPFFARNVLRRIREERSWRDRFAQYFSARRLIPAAAVALAMVAAAITMQRPANNTAVRVDSATDAVAQLDDIDYEVVADLDDLLASEDDTLWGDSDTLTL